MTVAGLIAEDNAVAALNLLGADADLDRVAIRGNRVLEDGNGLGIGIDLATAPAGAPSVARIRRSVIDQAFAAGVGFYSSLGSVESTLIRDTRAGTPGGRGNGIQVVVKPGAEGAPGADVAVR